MPLSRQGLSSWLGSLHRGQLEETCLSALQLCCIPNLSSRWNAHIIHRPDSIPAQFIHLILDCC